MVPVLIAITIVAFLVFEFFRYRSARRHSPATARAEPGPIGIVELTDLARVPAATFLDPGHTWLRLEDAGTALVGCDRLPLTLLGEPDRVTVPPRGTEVRRGDPLVTLRRGDRELTLRSPLTGRVEGVNRDAVDWPAQTRIDPFGRGWLLRIAPQRLAGALRRMAVADEAGPWMLAELRRLRDALSGLGRRGTELPAALPDGGLPVNGLAARLPAGAWAALTRELFEDRGVDRPRAQQG